MPFIYQILPLLLLVITVSVSSHLAAQENSSPTQSNTQTERMEKRIQQAFALERLGLYQEAEFELLAALAIAAAPAAEQITEALQRVRLAQSSENFPPAGRDSDKHFRLGQELYRQKHYEEALRAFTRAYEEADNTTTENRARAAILDTLDARSSIFGRLSENLGDDLISAIRVILGLFLGLFLIWLVL